LDAFFFCLRHIVDKRVELTYQRRLEFGENIVRDFRASPDGSRRTIIAKSSLNWIRTCHCHKASMSHLHYPFRLHCKSS
jgi:hypothetical protein